MTSLSGRSLVRLIGPLTLAAAVAWALASTVSEWNVSRSPRPTASSSVEASQPAAPAGIGFAAPDFQLTTLDDSNVRLADFRGNPLVLNFFASWCDPCKEESPVVKTIASDAGPAGYAVLGVAIEDERESLVWFLQEEQLVLSVAMDRDSRVSRAYQVIGPPTTVFIDAEGAVRDIHAGPLTPARAQAGLAKAKGEAADRTTLAPPDGTRASGTEAPGVTGAAALALALVAGLLSFLSPCVLPLLPAYLAYITGLSLEALGQPDAVARQRRRLTSRTVAFTLGLVLAFTALGASASAIGAWLADYRFLLASVSGVLILAFGLHLMGLLNVPILQKEFRPALRTIPLGHGGGILSAAALGGAFAIGWTPCIGPVLGSILLLAGQAETTGQGVLLLAAYGAGLGIPFIVVGIAIGVAAGLVASLRRHVWIMEKASGGLLVGMGLLLLSGKLSALSAWLQRVT